MKTHNIILLQIICLCFLVTSTPLFSQTTQVNSDHAAYYDKVFHRQYIFTPVDNKIMIKFAENNRQFRSVKQSVIQSYDLNTEHEAIERYRYGVYVLPGGSTVSAIHDQLKHDPNVKASCPLMVDQDGYERYFIPDEFTVQFNKNMSRDEMLQIIDDYGCKVVKQQWTYGYYTLSVPPGHELFETIRAFIAMDQTMFAELSFIGFNDYCFDPDDTQYTQQWALNNTGAGGGDADADIDAREAWDIERGDPDVLVVVIDTGIEWDHPDLRENVAQNLGEDSDGDGRTMQQVGGNWVRDPGDLNGVDDDGNGLIDDLFGWDFADDDNDPTPQALTATDDSYPHGTACAGIAAAVTDNNLGVAGIAHNCRLMGLRVNLTSGMNQNRADAINYAVDMAANYDAVVLSCSWVASGTMTALQNAVINARNNNVLPCFASGNGNTTPIRYPARYAQTLAVGATSECDERKSTTSCDGENWWGSNYGDSLNVSAPGVHLRTTDMVGADGYGGGDYIANMNGTSGATPHVAAAAALLWSYDPSLSVDEVQDILQQSADKVGGYDYSHAASMPGHSVELGYGRLNVDRALQMLMARTGAITDMLPDPLDLAISIDRSGSMITSKLDAVKNAASQVVWLMNIGDRLSVTMYDDLLDPVFPAAGGVIDITSSTTKEDAESAILSITRRGLTSIGGGLSYAQTQLSTITTPYYPQAIILMSDGMSNTAPWVFDTVPTIPALTDVYTIGFGTAGENVDEDSLRWIATQTGGTYLFAGADALFRTEETPLNFAASTGGLEIIKAYQASFNLANRRQIMELYGSALKEQFRDEILVDESVGDMRFSLLGDDYKGEYGLILTDPNGKEINPEVAEKEDLIDYIEGPSVRSYTVRHPEGGIWMMEGYATGSKYYISASGYSSLKTFLSLWRTSVCRPMLIRLRIIQQGEPIYNAEVTARVGFPNNEYTTIELYDDGEHGDGQLKDGVFANYFDNTCAAGSYSVETTTRGRTLKGLAFTRYNVKNTFITKAPELLVIDLSMPDLISPQGELLKVPVQLNSNVFGREIQGFQGYISYNPDVISPYEEAILEGTLCSENWKVIVKETEKGMIEVTGEGKYLSEQGILLILPFKVVGEKPGYSDLIFKKWTFLGGEGDYEVELTDGSFKVGQILMPDVPTDVKKDHSAIPEHYALQFNYPNPFNPVTNIQYDLPENTNVNLTVYNILGQQVKQLIERYHTAGYYTLQWDGTDAFGRSVSSGLYFYRLKTDGFVDVKKMFLLK